MLLYSIDNDSHHSRSLSLLVLVGHRPIAYVFDNDFYNFLSSKSLPGWGLVTLMSQTNNSDVICIGWPCDFNAKRRVQKSRLKSESHSLMPPYNTKDVRSLQFCCQTHIECWKDSSRFSHACEYDQVKQ